MALHSNTDYQSDTRTASTSGVNKGLLYLLVGGGIGAVVALLLAPKSGAELRTDISDITRKGYDGTLDLAQQLKGQSAELYDNLKEKADNVVGMASEKLSRAKDKTDDLVQQSGDIVNGEIRRLDDSLGRKNPDTGFKSSGTV